MIFVPTKLRDAYVVGIQQIRDARGFFARSWCRRELEAQGMNSCVVQANIGFSRRRGTIRGMHYQVSRGEEAKLVRCTRGAIYDVIIDLRSGSPTYKEWFGVELTATNYQMVYVPEGFAHGYQTLSDDTEICYQTSQFYAPECARGVRYDDPAFGITWPLPVAVISDADRNWPPYAEGERSKEAGKR